MCHVIVTCRSMLWTLFSIVVAFAELIAFMSPDWLMGFPRSDSNTSRTGADTYRPSLGLYSRCLRIGNRGIGVSCGPYAGTFGEVASGFWQAAMLFLAAGTLVLGGVACISIFSLCFQSILKKSLFNICGLLQAIAGKTAGRKTLHCGYTFKYLFFHIILYYIYKYCIYKELKNVPLSTNIMGCVLCMVITCILLHVY